MHRRWSSIRTPPRTTLVCIDVLHILAGLSQEPNADEDE